MERKNSGTLTDVSKEHKVPPASVSESKRFVKLYWIVNQMRPKTLIALEKKALVQYESATLQNRKWTDVVSDASQCSEFLFKSICIIDYKMPENSKAIDEPVRFLDDSTEFFRESPDRRRIKTSKLSIVKNNFDYIRLYANPVKHSSYTSAKEDSIGCINAMKVILKWYFKEHYNYEQLELSLYQKKIIEQLFNDKIENVEKQLNTIELVKLEMYLTELKKHYSLFNLDEGCKIAGEALDLYPFQEDILRWWALFHNRNMRWTIVRNILSEKIIKTHKDTIKTMCYLAIFESHLNEFTKDRHKPHAFEKLKAEKINTLDLIPDKDQNGQYHYFLARFFEEEWWVSTEEDKCSSSLINHAIISINKSIELYCQANSGYQASAVVPWWLYCHKTILLKIWGHPNFHSSLQEFGTLILTEIERNILMKSLQMYACSYFLLLDKDPKDLENFLEVLKGKIVEKSFEITVVDNFTYHHIELIFYNDEAKRKVYFDILKKWFQGFIN